MVGWTFLLMSIKLKHFRIIQLDVSSLLAYNGVVQLFHFDAFYYYINSIITFSLAIYLFSSCCTQHCLEVVKRESKVHG
jgi:hypothetical protein